MTRRVLEILTKLVIFVSLALFIMLITSKTMIINTCYENSPFQKKISKVSNVANIDGGFAVNLKSESSEIQSFKLLCLFQNNNGKSVCEDEEAEVMPTIINKVYLDPPSEKPYGFSVNPPVLNGQTGVPEIIDKLLRGKQNGFYIESGALDGEYLSNSLFFELKRNFTGLLIEPDVFSYKKLLNKNRKAYSINACYSLTGYPTLVDFKTVSGYPELSSIKKLDQTRNSDESSAEQLQTGNMQESRNALCLPFYSIILALGNPVVDYLSLDIEGTELPVLKTIPWHRVHIKVLSIECGLIDSCLDIRKFMQSVGYFLVVQHRQDIILARK